MESKETNFLDSKTVIAIVLVGAVWFGWQNYLAKKYPSAKMESQQNLVAKEGKPVETKTLVIDSKTNVSQKVILPAQTFGIFSNEANFTISSLGLGLKNIELNSFTKRDKSKIQFATDIYGSTFEMSLLDNQSPIQFKVIKKSDTLFEGSAVIGNTKITRSIEYIPVTYSFKNTISILNADKDFKGFQIALSEAMEEYKSSGFLVPSYDHQEFIVSHSGDKYERINISSAKDKINSTFPDVSIAAISSQYFASAILDKSEIIPTVELFSDPSGKIIKSNLIYRTVGPKNKMEFVFTTFTGPKAHATLEAADPSLTGLINFGFFSSIGKILLTVLQKFHSLVGNWGLSIVLLTLLVRAIVLPFNIASYKSMKKMQRIQPLMQSLREQYKEDPQALNRETMLLMKQEKVNPLGGCLPMFLQMPVFFALYQVLGQSIELYQAPFFGWIMDLSLKDPFYILPILMGVTLWVQHKITPTTMDPAQAKVMQFMPIIFSVMMVSLPSGLTLYTFVSTLFGVLQQQFFMRDKHALSKA